MIAHSILRHPVTTHVIRRAHVGAEITYIGTLLTEHMTLLIGVELIGAIIYVAVLVTTREA